MAGKKRNQKTPSIKLNFSKIHTIWKSLSIPTWFEILNKYSASNNWTEKAPGDIWGACPFHGEDTASFHIVPWKGYAFCFGCNIHVSDPIKLVSRISKQTYSESFSFVVNQYGPLPGFTAKSLQHVHDYAELQHTKDVVFKLLNTELVDAAASLLTENLDQKYEYARGCLVYLRNRNIPLDMLHALPLGIVCPPGNLYDRIKEYEKYNNEKVGHAVQSYLEMVVPKGSSSERSNFEGWLVFVNHISPNTLGTFRIREPSMDGAKAIIAINAPEPEGNPVGFFGLGTAGFQPLLGQDNQQSKVITVVEGEFDALAAIIPQLTTSDLRSLVVSAGGNVNVNLNSLAISGFETVNYIPDWDEAGLTVLQSKLRATDDLSFRVFSPPDSFKQLGKDLHDSYMALGDEVLLQEIFNEKNYLFLHQWAIARSEETSETIAEGDIKSKTQLVNNYTKLLKDYAERDLYLKAISNTLGLDEELLKRYASPDTDEGFIELACNYLESIYEFVYQENVHGGKKVVAWNKAKAAYVHFDISRTSSILSILRVDLGSLVDWIEEKIGIPPDCQPHMDEEGNMIPKPRDRKHLYYETCFENDVIPRLLQRKPIRMRSDMTSFSQGIHIPDDKRIYIVNGNQVFKGIIDTNQEVKWVELTVPQDEEYLFEADPLRKWSTSINSVEDLVKDVPFSLDQLLSSYYNVFDTGFRFVNHELECLYLSTFLLTAPVIDLFDHVPWIFINGPTSTGKSSLNQVLAGQELNKRQVTTYEHAISMDSATPAGIKQSMRGTTLTLALDEFEVGPENSYENKHIKCREILELVRGSMGRGAKISLGSAGGTPIYWTLRFPFVASGIYPFHKPEDINRFNTVEMAVKDPLVSKIKISSPKHLILKKFPVDVIQAIREASTLCVIRNIVAIKQAYQEIKQEFASGQFTDSDTHARFREQLLPIFAVQKAAGRQYKNFALQYTAAKSHRSLEITTQFKHDEIWQLLMHTSALVLPDEIAHKRTFTLAQIIEDVHKRGMLNSMNSGVYYLQEEELLAVVWTTAMNGPLLKSTKFYNYGGPDKIRNIMSYDNRIVDDKARNNYRGLLAKLSAYVGRVAWKDITFIPIKEFLTDHTLNQSTSDNLVETSMGIKNLKVVDSDKIQMSGTDNI